MTKRIYSKKEVMEVHKKCCPYHNPNMGERKYNQPIRCGLNYEECNGNCWYIDTFKKELKKLKLRLREYKAKAQS